MYRTVIFDPKSIFWGYFTVGMIFSYLAVIVCAISHYADKTITINKWIGAVVGATSQLFIFGTIAAILLGIFLYWWLSIVIFIPLAAITTVSLYFSIKYLKKTW